jgi:hypothetical protein
MCTGGASPRPNAIFALYARSSFEPHMPHLAAGSICSRVKMSGGAKHTEKPHSRQTFTFRTAYTAGVFGRAKSNSALNSFTSSDPHVEHFAMSSAPRAREFARYQDYEYWV